MAAFYESIDTVLMGRKTYEVGLKLGQKLYAGERNLVFSRTRRRSGAPGVDFVRRDLGDFAKRLRDSKGKDIWLVGGAGLIAAFLDGGQIDAFIIHVIPTFIGQGIALIQPRHRDVPLALLSSRSYPDGVLRLHYSVGPQTVGGHTDRVVARRQPT
jgi:dihydrofolate reductase